MKIKRPSVCQIATPELEDKIDEAVIKRLRKCKEDAEKAYKKAGTAAAIDFVDRTARYDELTRLERWWTKFSDDPQFILTEFTLSDLAVILAGTYGDEVEVQNRLEHMGGIDAADEHWMSAFMFAAVERFKEIKATL